jgi:hypothetical protein
MRLAGLGAQWPDFAGGRSGMLGYSILLVGALLCAWIGYRIGQTEEALASRQEQLETQRAAAAMLASQAERITTSQAPKKKPTISLVDRQARDDGIQLVKLLSLDWPKRLAEIEKGARGSVQFNSMRVDSGAQAIEVRGEVNTLNELDQLRAAWLEAGIPMVMIGRHESIERDGKTRYDFQASLAWERR